MKNQKSSPIPGAEGIHVGYAALFPGKLFGLKKDLPERTGIKILNGSISGGTEDEGMTSVNSCWLENGRIVVPTNVASHPLVSRLQRGGRPSPEGPLQPTYILKAAEQYFKDDAGRNCVVLACNLNGTAPLGSIIPINNKGIVAFVNNITTGIAILAVTEVEVASYKHLAYVSMKEFMVNSATGEVSERVINSRVVIVEEDAKSHIMFTNNFGEQYGDMFLVAMDTLQSMAEGKPQTAMWVKDITRPVADPTPDAPAAPVEEPAPMPAQSAKGKKAKSAVADEAVGNNGHTDKVPAPAEAAA